MTQSPFWLSFLKDVRQLITGPITPQVLALDLLIAVAIVGALVGLYCALIDALRARRDRQKRFAKRG